MDGGVGQQFKLSLSGVPQPGPDGIQAAVSTEHRGSFRFASPGAQFYWPTSAGPGRTKTEYQTDAMADAMVLKKGLSRYKLYTPLNLFTFIILQQFTAMGYDAESY